MGDRASHICNDCGRSHPQFEDHHRPFSQNRPSVRDIPIAPSSWEDFKVCKPLHNPFVEVHSHPCPETIVAAAIRIPVSEDWQEKMWRGVRSYPDFLTISAPPPARHGTLMHPFFDYHERAIGPGAQGFLTSTGRYVDRREAQQIAISSNQPRVADNPTWDQLDELYSEDLW